MEEMGIVKSINGINAKVLVSRNNSCCEKDTCDIPQDGIGTEAINVVGAKVGQRVKVVMKSYAFLKGALVLYILPVFALIAGAIPGKLYLPAYFARTDSDLPAALGGFIAFFASLILVKIISGRMSRKTENKSIIEAIVEG